MQLKIVIYLNKEIHIEVQLEKRYAKYYSLLNSHMIIVKHVDRSSIDLFHVVRYCFLNNALSLYGSYDCT